MNQRRTIRIMAGFALLALFLCFGSADAFSFDDFFGIFGLYEGINDNGHDTVYLEAPLNESVTGLDNSSLEFVFNHTGFLLGVVNCTLFLDGAAVNYTTNASAGISRSVYSNSSFGDGQHWWWVNCTNGTDDESSADDGYNYTFLTDQTPPNVTLNLPQANYYNDTSDPLNVTFNCSAADDNGLTNISLYITNPANQSFALNQTTNITGASNSSTWTLELSSGNYTWNCLVYDNADQSGWGDSNRTLSVNTSSAEQNDSYEPDNNHTLANWIATDGTPQSHTFTPAGDTDWIRFNATESAKYIIQTSALGNGADTNITLYEQNGETNITENDDIESGVIRRSKIIWTATGTGTYFVKARDWNASHPGGSYNISITELPNITLSLLGNSNRDVQKGELFNITLNVSCSGINCTGLEIYLDPEKQKPKRPQQRPSQSANLLDRLDSLPEGEYDVIIILKDITAKELMKSKSKLSRHVGVRSTRRPKLEARKQAVTTRQNAVLSGLGASQRSTRTMRTVNTAPDEFTLKRKYNVINALSGRITKQGMEALKNNPDVKSVQLSRKLAISLDTSAPQIKANDTWATQYNGVNITGEGQTVCIIDSGIDYGHADFGGDSSFPNNKIIGGYDFFYDDADPSDENGVCDGHGTHVAGTVASQNATYKGVAPDAKIVSIKSLGISGPDCAGSDTDIIAGIDWCVYHAEELNISVISMSLGDNNKSTTYCDSDPMAIAINYANDYGIVVAVAAGNDGWTDGVSHPACASGATTVSSIQKDDSTFNYNRGPLTNVVAPGYNIVATNNGGGHISKDGTSMATPHVAGAAALLNQYYKLHDGLNLHAEQIETTLEDSGTIKHDAGSGLNFSRVDVLAALSEPIPKGIISTQSNATPFYTLNSNPNITSMDAGTSKQITWTINATGSYGTYDFFAFTNLDDGEDEITSNNVNITIVDNTYPQLNIESPEADAILDTSTVDFIFNVTDELDDTLSCSLYLNGQLNQTNTSVSEGISANFTKTLDDGNYSWHINCTDAYSNCNFTAPRNLTVDATYPVFSDYKRTPNAPNEEENVQVNVTLSEASGTVTLEWNGTTNYTVTTNSGLEYYFTILNGTNYTAHDTITYYWYANDTAGNLNKSDEQSFTIANQLPTVSAPSLNDTTPQTTDVINCTGGTFNDNDEEDTEQNRTYRWYDNSAIISGQTSQTLNLSVSGLDKGDNITCSVRVDDGYNWSIWVNSTNNATIQNTSPNPPTVNAPLNGATNQELSVTLNVTVTDPDGDTMNVTFWNNATGQQIGNTTNIANGNYANITWPNLNYSTTYYWYANSTDGEYMKKSNIWNITTKDSPAFSIHLNSPDTQTAINDNTPDFNFTVSGTGTSYNCSLYMNGTSKESNETVSNNTATAISTTLTDGNYVWYINCTLAGVANSSETRTLTVDATSPAITILSPNIHSNYSTQAVSFNTTLNEPGSGCGYSLDDAPNTTMTNTAGTWGHTNQSMTETQHTVQFYCNDTAGNMANTTERTFTIDISPPTFNTPTPANHSTTNTDITLNAADSGTGIASVKYSANNSANVTSSTIPITSLAEGANTIDAYAEDFAGNINHTQYVYIKDITAPVLTINLPTNSTETTTNETELNYSLDEPANATWYTIDSDVQNYLDNSKTADNLTINFTDTAGRHILYVYANDSVGNLRQKTIHIRYNTVFNMSNYTQSLEDTTGTNITITANTSGDITDATAWLNETLNMTLNTTDTIVSLENFYGLSAVWSESFTMNTTNSTVSDEIIEIGTNVSKMIYFSGLDKFLENTQYNGTATFSPYNSSAYTDVIYCTADNSDSCTRIGACINSIFNGTACYIDKLTNITVHVPHFSSVILGNDTIAPQIAIDTPANTETNGFDININLTVTQDTTACNYTLNHSALTNITMTKTSATHFTKTIGAFLPDGDYALNVTCKDANNNYNTTSKTFTVLDNIKPAMSTPSASKTTTSATISWTTDEKTDAMINYSTSPSLGINKSAPENTTSHSIAISGLSSSTTYYYNITSCDLEDNCNTTGPHSFTTSASGDIGGTGTTGGRTTGGAIIPPQAEEEEPEQQTEPKKEEEEPKEEQATPEEDTRQKQEAQELISSAEHKIQSLKDKYDLKAAIDKLNEAKKAFESKDYAKAKLLAAEALKLISQAEPKAEPQKAAQCPIIPHKILNICFIYIITTLIVLTLAALLIISNRKKLSKRAPKTESPLPIHNTETTKPHKKEPEHHHHLDINEEISRLLKSLSEAKPLLDSKDTVLAMDANNKIDQISLEIDQAKELMRSGNKHEAARHIKRGSRLLESIKEELSDSA